MILLALLASLSFAAEQRAETKEELSMRLLGVLPTATAEVAETTTPRKVIAPLPTVTAPSRPESLGATPGPTLSEAVPAKVEATNKLARAPEAAVKPAQAPEAAVLPTAAGRGANLPTLVDREPNVMPSLPSEWVTEVGSKLTTKSDDEPAQGGGMPSFPWWLPAALLGGLGLVLLSRREGGLSQLGIGNGSAPMRVLSRTALGQNSGLALVELDEGDGSTRRVLVGFGGGSPNLVAELGLMTPMPEEEDQVFEAHPSLAPLARIPTVEDFGFQPTPARTQLSANTPPIDLPSEPVINEVLEKPSSARRSVLDSKTRTLRPPESQSDFAEILKDEFEAPIPRRSAEDARALVEEVLAARQPEQTPEPTKRNPRPWAGSRFQGTA